MIPSSRPAPYRPIAVGFLLLALPLFVAVFLAEDPSGRWTNAAAALVMCLAGLLLLRRSR